jgi:hypothetical protein
MDDLATIDAVPRPFCPGRDLQGRFGPIQHHQQLGLVGMKPAEQAVEGDEAGGNAPRL